MALAGLYIRALLGRELRVVAPLLHGVLVEHLGVVLGIEAVFVFENDSKFAAHGCGWGFVRVGYSV